MDTITLPLMHGYGRRVKVPEWVWILILQFASRTLGPI
jgi:hypothetical protein